MSSDAWKLTWYLVLTITAPIWLLVALLALPFLLIASIGPTTENGDGG